MESADSSLVPGFRLDRYELLCPIATGGMASVWLARLRGKRGFEKLFAIKTIKTELISDPHFQEMFLDEARIASRIIHPNVAQILELGEQDDILYIVMEYVDGDSVAKINRLANKQGAPLPPGVSLRIVSEMCAGLHAAHQLKEADGSLLGVVHRDVSPQNVLLTTEGSSKVIDFGLVKAKKRASAETKSGVVKGKIRYMAPEQVGGKALDHRADVWACGMCLYELISGQTPYADEDDLDVVKRLMSDDPLPRFSVALPPEIEAVIAKAIVKDPDDRFASCAVMRRAIEKAIHDLGLAAETDDVAEFLKGTLPDLATKRAQTIAKAIDAAETRKSRVSSLESLGPADMAFAQTEVSATDRLAEDALPLTRRRASDPPPTRRDGVSGLDSEGGQKLSSYGGRTNAATTLTAQLGERRRSSALLWIAALAAIGVGAWILFPRDHGGLITGAPPPPSATLSTPASVTPPPPTPVEAITPPAPSASVAIELDPVGEDAAPSTTAKLPPLPPPTQLRPRDDPRSLSFVPPPDGGLSPAAQSAAKIMLAPPPRPPDP